MRSPVTAHDRHYSPFMISQYMYAIGGLSIQGECLQEIVMMNVSKKECKVHNI